MLKTSCFMLVLVAGALPPGAAAQSPTTKTSAEVSTASATVDSTPGSGAWANYDFIPGNRPLFVNDFADDAVGSFPKRLSWGQGNFEVVEWRGKRFVRATSSGWLSIPLGERLPDAFTVELELYAPGGWNQELVFGPAARGEKQPRVLLAQHASGVIIGTAQTVSAPARSYRGELFPVRLVVDGSTARVYMGESRVANIPQIDLGRDRSVRLFVRAQQGAPVMLGDVRIMAGRPGLSTVLAASGRVATQGVRFHTGEATVLPQSTPTLKEIAAMLAATPALRLLIEGHTDNIGNPADNQRLSERRAAAVRDVLVQRFDVDGTRLSVRGLGDSTPVAPNASAEGRQANRRVELVREP